MRVVGFLAFMLMIMVVLMGVLDHATKLLPADRDDEHRGRGLVVKFRRQLGVRRHEARRLAVGLAFDRRSGERELLAQAFARDVDRRFLRRRRARSRSAAPSRT